MREFVRKSNRRSINSGFSSLRIVFKLNASLCLLVYCVSDCLCCCRCGQSMRKCCIVYCTVLLHLWHVGGGRCIAAHVLSLFMWEDRGSLQHGSELTWVWYFAPYWPLCRVIFAWAHLKKILGAPLVKATRFGHVAYLEMRLDETNTSVKVSVLYLDYSGSYWQISVYVAVIDDIKINRIVKIKKINNNVSSESLIQELHFGTSFFL